jgi:hypothetical protein
MKSSLRILAVMLTAPSTATLAADRPPVAPAAPEQVVHAPFSLKWGEDAGQIERKLIQGGARIVAKHRGGTGEVFEVTGLHASAGLKRTFFGFDDERLTRVTLRYENSGWDAGKCQDAYEQIEKRFTSRYGPRHGSHRPASNTPALGSRAWNKPAGSLVLRLLKLEGGDQPGGWRIEVIYSSDAAIGDA